MTPPESFLMESPPGAEVIISGRRYLYFGGTSYYGLHAHPDLIQAGIGAWQTFGTNTATFRGGMGTAPAHAEVEAAVARFFGDEDAAYLASGYLSNVAGVQALRARAPFDMIFIDEHAHYCMAVAAGVTGVPVYRFKHRDPDHLEQRLKSTVGPGQTPLLMSDGVFPGTGEIAPAPDYFEALEKFHGLIWLDDAHAAGILGSHGRGTADHFGIENDRLYSGGTLAKAFGGFGGFVSGPAPLIGQVRDGAVMNAASAPPSPIAAATRAGVDLVSSNPQWRERLWANAKALKQGLRGLGLDVCRTPVPIAVFSFGDEAHARLIFDGLMDRGISIQISGYPGSAKGQTLRIVVFSTHTETQIERLIDELRILI